MTKPSIEEQIIFYEKHLKHLEANVSNVTTSFLLEEREEINKVVKNLKEYGKEYPRN